MRDKLGRALAVLSFGAALVLVAVGLGLMPARDAEPPRSEKLDLRKTVDTAPAMRSSTEPDMKAAHLELLRIPVCAAPADGARAYRVSLGNARDGLLVWCKGGYELLRLDPFSAPPTFERFARFASSLELPGGAAAADFDGDGAHDLMLGVAPAWGVLHRPLAGVYWVRGRKQGGYEAARSLIEAPTVALAAEDADGDGRDDLLALTRGDLAAQRPSELWVFAKGPTLTRVLVAPLGLEPLDLASLRSSGGVGPRALALTGQPGELWSVTLGAQELASAAPDRRSLSVRGGQAFVTSASGAFPVYVREPADVRAVVVDPDLALEDWAKGVSVGPSTLADLDADGRVELLGAVEHGVARVQASDGSARDELHLGETTQVRDVVSLRDARKRERVLALVQQQSELSLVFVPAPPWSEDVRIELQTSVVEDVPGMAEVALE